MAGRAAKKYEDSVSFKNNLRSIRYDVIEGIRVKKMLEMDGAYDSERIVDIKEFFEDGTISGENTSGLAYTLDELNRWGESWQSDRNDM